MILRRISSILTTLFPFGFTTASYSSCTSGCDGEKASAKSAVLEGNASTDVWRYAFEIYCVWLDRHTQLDLIEGDGWRSLTFSLSSEKGILAEAQTGLVSDFGIGFFFCFWYNQARFIVGRSRLSTLHPLC